MAKVELLGRNKIRLDSEATLEDIYSATDEWRLPVEPLSKRTAIADFLTQGGYGYGSLTEGSLASKILNLTWSKGGKSYQYGLPDATLYNAGYPLQRIVELGRSRILDMELGRIESLTLLAVEVSSPEFAFQKQEAHQIAVPSDANDAVFLNERTAALLGLDGAGLLTSFSHRKSTSGQTPEAWEKRFIEDALPRGLVATRVLTIRSNLTEMMDAAGPESYAVVLATLKGLVANIYCSSQTKGSLDQKVGSLKHCYLL